MGSVGLQLATALKREFKPAENGGVRLADGSRSPLVGHVILPITVAGLTRDLRVAIMPHLDADCYLGVNFVRAFRAVLDPDTDRLFCKDADAYVELEVASLTTDPSAVAAVGLADATDLQREELQALVESVLGGLPPGLGCVKGLEHEINVRDARPIKQRPYPVSDKVQEEMHRQTKEMLRQGIVEPSHSGWSSPVVMTPKSDGSRRFCCDMRKVNAVTEPDAYPLPNMQEILRKLRKAKFISTLDLKSAYHQIPLAAEARPITAFTVPGLGLFQFRRMPYGLTNAPATFQRLIDKVIGPELEPHVYAYLDDIIIVAETFEEHKACLKMVLEKLKAAGLSLNPAKCVFCKPEVAYLGFLVNRDGTRPDPAKVAPIKAYPTPKDLKGVRKFHGMASWYRRFIPNFATIAEPITRLTKKNYKFEWLDEQQHAFDLLKAMIILAPTLQRPDPNCPFIVQTDASDVGLGAVLLQEIEGTERVLEFASRVLAPAERNYSVTERECLAVVWAIGKFRPYIDGYEFKVVTDHSSLRWLCQMKNPTSRLARWALELQGHKFTIEHRRGALNYVADALSRIPEEEEGPAVAALSWSAETEDTWYQEWCTKVKEQPNEYPTYKLVAGNLYRYRPNQEVEATLGNDDDAWKLVVPEEHRREVLHECHDDSTAGHLGREKTFARVALRYYWPRYYAETQEYVRNCETCQRHKVEQRAPAGLMGRRVVDKPWQVVAGDIIGPLPRTSKGFEYILVFQDLFSRWAEASPIRKANAKAVVGELNQKVILRFGCPEVFLSDNGTEFKNRVVEDFLEERGVHHTHTPTYHPQANPVERANRTLKTMVASYLKERHNTWDEKLPELLFAMNTAVQSSTGVSPAMMLYGRQPEPPGTQRRLQEVAAETSAQEESLDRWKDRLDGLPDLHQRAAAQAKAAQDRQASYYDAGRREPDFKPGDKVWKRSHTLSSAAKGIAAKLAPKFEGPYWITAVLGSNTYRLVSDGGQIEEIVAADQLKPYRSEATEPPGTGTDPGSETEPAGEVTVEPGTGPAPTTPMGRPMRACNATVAPAKPPSTGPRVVTAPRRGRGRPRKNP